MQFAAALLDLPGRGLSLKLSAYYNARVWFLNSAAGTITFDIDRGWPAPGWTLGFGRLAIAAADQVMFIDSDGTRHSYSGSATVLSSTQRRFDGQTTDGTLINYSATIDDTNPSAPVLLSGSLRYPDGTAVDFTAQGIRAVYPTRLVDANGNAITITYRANTGPAIDTITDTLGRVFKFYYDSNNLPIAVTGPTIGSGAERAYARFHYQSFTLGYAFASSLTPVLNRSSPFLAVDAIVYPGPGTGYWFGDANSYSPYGMIRTTSERVAMSVSATGFSDSGTVAAGAMRHQLVYDYPLAADATLVDAPGYSTVTETWAHMDSPPSVTRYAVYSSASPPRVEITHPDATLVTVYSYASTSSTDAWKQGVTTRIETHDPSGVLIRAVDYTYELGYSGRARKKTETITNDLGQQAATVYTYGASYDQVVEVDQYDYNGHTLRVTTTEYLTDSNYVNRHIFNRPTKVRVYGPGTGLPGSGPNAPVLVRLTEYTYDGQPLTETPGIVQHLAAFDPASPPNCTQACYPAHCYYDCTCTCRVCDPAYCDPPVCTAVYDPNTAYRGNVTQVRSYADPVALTGASTRTFRYDIAGNVVTATASAYDATNFSFGTNTQYAWAESLRWGSPSDAALQMSKSTSYDFYSGLPVTETDENNLVTTNTYDPLSGRLLQRTYPTGAFTKWSFDDLQLTITEQGFDSSGVLAKQVLTRSNGLGLIWHSEVTSTATTVDMSDTMYDALGRVWKQSQPYRGSPSLWTTTQYDALGRVSAVQLPDGSTTSYKYNEAQRPSSASSNGGDTVRSIDAWGRERWVRRDALSRVVEVAEPNPGGSGSVLAGGDVSTVYDYDAFENIAHVVQGQQLRIFEYDGLGRRVRQALPEKSRTLTAAGAYAPSASGYTDVYQYDERGNLTLHVDARGVRTVYSYTASGSTTPDPLSRLQTITYDTSAAPTAAYIASAPTVTYAYWTSGDLTRVKTITAGGTSLEAYDYDGFARPKSYTLTLSSRPSFSFAVGYSYDSLNRIKEITYPTQYGVLLPGQVAAARKLVHFDFDLASRWTQLLVDGQAFASGATYNEAGKLSALALAPTTVAPAAESFEYEPDTGLLRRHTVSRAAASVLDLTHEYRRIGSTVGTYIPGKVAQATSAVNNLDDTRSRAYYYDAMGRLSRTTGGSIWAPTWSQTYSYDRYGNRVGVLSTGSPAGSTSAIPTDGLPALGFDSSSNRINTPGFTYDEEGNLTRGLLGDGATWHRYQYDAAGRLVVATNDAGVTLEKYTYGASRRRLVQQAGDPSNTRTYYVRSGDDVVAEFSESDSAPTSPTYSKAYFRWGDRLLATAVIGGTSETLKFFAADRFGPRLVLSAVSTTVWEQVTLPFGTELGAESTISTNTRYDNFDRSAVTKLDYARNRYYSSAHGRFCQVDPLGISAATLLNPQSLNLFHYSTNDPVNRRDPSGLADAACTDADGSTCGAGGGDEGWDDFGDNSELAQNDVSEEDVQEVSNDDGEETSDEQPEEHHCGVNPITRRPGFEPDPEGETGHLRKGVTAQGDWNASRDNNLGRHRGLDIAAPSGTPVYANRDGVVTFSGWKQGYGYTVQIYHGDDVWTHYNHLDGFSPMPGIGYPVTEGQRIATSGTSGNADGLQAEEQHLDFEVFTHGNKQDNDPDHYLNSDCPDSNSSSVSDVLRG